MRIRLSDLVLECYSSRGLIVGAIVTGEIWWLSQGCVGGIGEVVPGVYVRMSEGRCKCGSLLPCLDNRGHDMREMDRAHSFLLHGSCEWEWGDQRERCSKQKGLAMVAGQESAEWLLYAAQSKLEDSQLRGWAGQWLLDWCLLVFG